MNQAKYDAWRLSGPDGEPSDVGIDPGQTCGRYEEPDEDAPRGYKPKPCKGVMVESKVVGCSCHINPPCSACVDAGCTCDTCGFETAPQELEEPELPPPPKARREDRSDQTTMTHTVSHFNSTPFTRCCGTAAINTDRCPSCNALILRHDDGLDEVRRWAKGGCLMCGKPRGDIAIAGNCCC